MSGEIKLSNVRFLGDRPRSDISIISSPDVTSFAAPPYSNQGGNGQVNSGFDGDTGPENVSG